MSLLADIEAETAQPGYPCGIAKAIEALPADEADELRIALGRDTFAANAISRALAKRGVRVKAHTITRHRRRECRCGE